MWQWRSMVVWEHLTSGWYYRLRLLEAWCTSEERKWCTQHQMHLFCYIQALLKRMYSSIWSSAALLQVIWSTQKYKILLYNLPSKKFNVFYFFSENPKIVISWPFAKSLSLTISTKNIGAKQYNLLTCLQRWNFLVLSHVYFDLSLFNFILSV